MQPETAHSPQRHLSFYRFTRLAEPHALRRELLAFCALRSLRGTILLAEEGVNAMLSGAPEPLAELRAEAERRFGPGLDFKEAESDQQQAFSRLLVKVKKELISVGDPALRPDLRTAPRLCPAELRELLDRGEELVLLDTRNEYEVGVGTFRGAEHLSLDSSRAFARAAEARLPAWRGKTVVTFCTGGIRCEKASALLLERGLEKVYQLDGGILRYFAEQGGGAGAPHFEGACFVFDWRLAVNASLEPVPRSCEPGTSFGRHRILRAPHSPG